MRVSFSFYLAVFLALGVLFFEYAPASAQDIFLKKNFGSSSAEGEGGDSNIYLAPRSGNKTNLYNGNIQSGSVYSGNTRREQRRVRPSTTVSRNSELDRIQQANIAAAQAKALRNAQILEKKRKVWDAQRAAADEAARKRQMEMAGQKQNGEQSATESRDMSNATYLKQNPMDAPKRTFNVFQ